MATWREFRVTSPYGERNDPFTGEITHHTGIDLVQGFNTPIRAFTSGIVIHARMGIKWSGFGGFGNVVAIKDKYSALHCYAHLESIHVKVGQEVHEGDIIGTEGSTGRSTGSHLHYEVREKAQPSYGYGTDTNPRDYLIEYMDKEPKPLPKVQGTINVIVDGSSIGDGYLINNTTYVPIRRVAEELNYQVGYDGVSAIINTKK